MLPFRSDLLCPLGVHTLVCMLSVAWQSDCQSYLSKLNYSVYNKRTIIIHCMCHDESFKHRNCTFVKVELQSA